MLWSHIARLSFPERANADLFCRPSVLSTAFALSFMPKCGSIQSPVLVLVRFILRLLHFFVYLSAACFWNYLSYRNITSASFTFPCTP